MLGTHVAGQVARVLESGTLIYVGQELGWCWQASLSLSLSGVSFSPATLSTAY